MTHEDPTPPMDAMTSTVQRPGNGGRVRVMTDQVMIRIAATQTGGAFSLFEMTTPPAGGCPPHTQRYDDETLYVLDGRYDVLIGEQTLALGPGDVVIVPRETVHAYANAGSAPARMLMLLTPGGIKEQFFDEVGDPVERMPWEMDMARVLAVAPKYGIAFSSPED